MAKIKVEYSHNNSGGRWWLKDKDWEALEKAGWKVRWIAKDKYAMKDPDGKRFLGALAQEATRSGLSLEEAVAEWEKITGLESTDPGCSCCGQPHTFTETNGIRVRSGPNIFIVGRKPSMTEVAEALEGWGRQLIVEHEVTHHCGPPRTGDAADNPFPRLHSWLCKRVYEVSWDGGKGTRWRIEAALERINGEDRKLSVTIADVLRLTHEDLLMTKGVGVRRLAHVKSTLKRMGICWLPEGGYRALEDEKEEKADASPTV